MIVENSRADFGIFGWVSRRVRCIIDSQLLKDISSADSSCLVVSLNTALKLVV